MEQRRVDLFIAINAGKFPAEQLPRMQEMLLKMDETQFSTHEFTAYKTPLLGFIISFFFGTLGIDRFYLGHIGLGILKLITCGGLGIWTLIDWFLIIGLTKKANYKKFLETCFTS